MMTMDKMNTRVKMMINSKNFEKDVLSSNQPFCQLHEMAMDTQAAGYNEAMEQTKLLRSALGDDIFPSHISTDSPVIFFAGRFFDLSPLFLSETERQEFGRQMARTQMDNVSTDAVVDDCQIADELFTSAIMDDTILDARSDALMQLLQETDGEDYFMAAGHFTLMHDGGILPLSF